MMFQISREGIQDLLYLTKIMAEIIAIKPLTEEEDEKLKYATKLLDRAFEQFCKDNPLFKLN